MRLKTGRVGSFRGSEVFAFGREDRREWREWLQGSGMHDFYQGAEFHGLAQGRGEGIARLYVLRDGDSSFGLPCLLRNLPFPVGHWRWDATSVRGYPGPWITGEGRGFPGRALGALEEWLREEGVLTVFSLLNPVLGQARWLEGVGELRPLGRTVAMDLSGEESEVWAGIRPSHRRGIRRLEETGFWCGIEEPLRGVGDFAVAYGETMARVGAGGSYLHGEEFFRELFAAHGEWMHLWLVRLGGAYGEVVGGALFGEGSGIGEYYLSGTRDAWVGLSPMKKLLDAAWRWGRRRGWRYLHLGGGVGSEDSLFEFKAGFSPCRFPMSCWSWVLDGVVYGQCCRQAAAEWERGGWEVARRGFFPWYRSPVEIGAGPREGRVP